MGGGPEGWAAGLKDEPIRYPEPPLWKGVRAAAVTYKSCSLKCRIVCGLASARDVIPTSGI